MKKINKMMLLSMSAFVPLVTVVACSSNGSTTEVKALEVSGVAVTGKTAASTVVKMKVKNLPASPELAKLVLHVVEDKESGAAKTLAASKLTGEDAEFEFKNVLTAGQKYKLVKVEYDAKQTSTFEDKAENKFELAAAAATA